MKYAGLHISAHCSVGNKWVDIAGGQNSNEYRIISHSVAERAGGGEQNLVQARAVVIGYWFEVGRGLSVTKIPVIAALIYGVIDKTNTDRKSTRLNSSH